MIKVEYFGHSCFKIAAGDYALVLDPYSGVPGYPPLNLTANGVICSHEHFDHNNLAAVKCTLNLVPKFFKEESVATFHDDKNGALRGRNNITLLSGGGFKIAHFGDLGCELNNEQAEKLSGLDLALIPVGGKYTINPKQAKELIERINPKLTIPMHYKTNDYGLKDIADLGEFTRLFDGVTYINSNVIDLPNDVSNKIAVLEYVEQE